MSASPAADLYEFTVEEYHKLADVLFDEDDRVELLNGNIIVMSPIDYRHMNAVRKTTKAFFKLVREECEIGVQSSIILDDKSEPEPDITLLDTRVNLRKTPPLSEDVLLLVEVADSTLHFDRTDKRDAYARNYIAEYWLLDLARNELIVYRNSDGFKFLDERVLRSGDSVAPLAFPHRTVQVQELLPQ